MMTVDPTKDLTAVGRLAGRLGCDVDTVMETAERLEITPAMRVDRVVFFDRAAAERIAEHLANTTKGSK
jgi:hypothetical protein